MPERGADSLQDAVWTPLRQFFAHPGFLSVLCFILLYKLGDMALGPMVRPFWVDRHFSMLQIGAVPGTLGVVTTVLGALLGGSLTKRWGVIRALWLLGIAQAASNLTYATAAAFPPSTTLMYTASVVESFCGGLGTAPFLAFLMSICDKTHAATQYALLSALFAPVGLAAATVSGWAVERLGYTAYFSVTFVLAWPALLLLPWVRRWTVARTAVLHASSPDA
jgi:PAT family beta-lactamase induction signal transducer AmpG